MPVSRYMIFKCLKCGYKFKRLQGDVIFPLRCPKCNSLAKIVNSNPTFFDDVKRVFENLFKGK
jgi:DNA-directed RNA polymerase subunit RPC12/RpoP